jgi:hypothetical protein
MLEVSMAYHGFLWRGSMHTALPVGMTGAPCATTAARSISTKELRNPGILMAPFNTFRSLETYIFVCNVCLLHRTRTAIEVEKRVAVYICGGF